MTTATAQETTFTTRDVPWMKMGKLLNKPVTAAAAIKQAGLDFTVSLDPAGFLRDGEWHQVKNRVAVVRDDTSELFEFVGAGYTPLQYAEAFDFMDTINPHYVAAGAIRGGKQGFLVIQPGRVISPAGDKIEMFVVLRTSHDRSRGVEISIMSLRNKCMNQLTLRSFAKDAPQRWSISHTRNLPEKLHEATIAMTRLDGYTEMFSALTERLMVAHPTEKKARVILDKVILHGGKKRGEEINKIVELWHNDTDRVGFNDTSWGLVNAVSEYLEHQRRARKDNVEARFTQALQGYTHSAINGVVEMVLAA